MIPNDSPISNVNYSIIEAEISAGASVEVGVWIVAGVEVEASFSWSLSETISSSDSI